MINLLSFYYKSIYFLMSTFAGVHLGSTIGTVFRKKIISLDNKSTIVITRKYTLRSMSPADITSAAI